MSRSLSPLALQFSMPEWNVAVLYRAQHEMSPVSAAFLEELRGVARQIIAGGQARGSMAGRRGAPAPRVRRFGVGLNRPPPLAAIRRGPEVR